MSLPEKDQRKEPVDGESLPQVELRRVVQEYIDDLREFIRKLRRKLH
jgi:hypothetical protein